jgi:hypothetical protein
MTLGVSRWALTGKVCVLLSSPDDTWPAEGWTLSALGQDGIVVRFGDGRQAQTAAAIGFGAAVRAAELEGVVEVATALTSVLVRRWLG